MNWDNPRGNIMSTLIKTAEDGRKLTVDGIVINLDGKKEAEDLVPVVYHPNRENIEKAMPEATHMAGRVPLTWEQALPANAALKEGHKALENDPQAIAERIRKAQNIGMLCRD